MDLHSRSVIKSQVILHEMQLVLCKHIYFSLFRIHTGIALALRLQCIGQACKKYAEDHRVEPCMHLSELIFKPVCTSMYQYVLNR